MSVFVNHIEITDEEVGQEMQYHPAPTQEQAWRLATQSLVVRQLLLQQAANNGMYAEESPLKAEQEAELIDDLLRHDVTVPEADDATCLRYYESHPKSFIDPESGKRLPYDEAKAYILDYLHTQGMRMAVAEYIRALSYSATIKGFELKGAEITLAE